MQVWRAVATLGFAHAAIDATTGFALASLVDVITPVRLVILITIYNAVAFALQPAVGLLVDRVRAPHTTAVLGLVVAGCGMIVAASVPLAGIIGMGIGSALFHVSGGALACAATPGRSAGPGFFTGPGVIGLSIGTALGLLVNGAEAFVLAALFVAIVALAKTAMAEHHRTSLADEYQPLWLIAIALLVLGVAARSSVWSATQTAFMGEVDILLALGIAAGVGKMLGGLAGDKFGGPAVAIGSLVIACGLLLAPTPGRFVLGILLLQSSTPIILAEVVRRMPRFPATATGLVLGFALALGGIPLMFYRSSELTEDAVRAAFIITAVVFFFVGFTRIRRRRDA